MASPKPDVLFLEAAVELTRRQRELLPLLARALGRTAFDYWILGEGRGDPAVDAVEATRDGEWRFHFHGLEVDVRHCVDGRTVRIDFGPDGVPAFTPEGVGAFIFASRSPWPTFSELRPTLAGPVGYDYARCVDLSEELRHQGLIDYVAPEVVTLVTRYGRLDPKRGHVLDIPKELRPKDENVLLLCDRLFVTDKGEAFVAQVGSA
jgi:hypothetical protein